MEKLVLWTDFSPINYQHRYVVWFPDPTGSGNQTELYVVVPLHAETVNVRIGLAQD